MHLVTLIGVAATVFASTNIDDVFLLLVFFADPRFAPSQVVLGQYLGIGLLVAVSVVGSLVALVVPEAWIGLLGIFPLAIGAMKLREAWSASDEEEEQEESPDASAGYSNIVAVASVTIANGGDNLGVYIPLFATYALWEVAIMGRRLLRARRRLVWARLVSRRASANGALREAVRPPPAALGPHRPRPLDSL